MSNEHKHTPTQHEHTRAHALSDSHLHTCTHHTHTHTMHPHNAHVHMHSLHTQTHIRTHTPPTHPAPTQVHLRDKPIAAEIDYHQLAVLTGGMSGAQIAGVANTACFLASREGRWGAGGTRMRSCFQVSCLCVWKAGSGVLSG
jgi:hypothetical protein